MTTDDPPTPPSHRPPVRRLGRPRLPAVLRDEPQYRLLFSGQVLSILGDRVTGVVLPFAVLSVGGGVGDVAVVSAAQFLPFAVLALPAGVWADRLDRKKILVASDVVRFVCQLTAGLLLVTGRADVLHLALLAAAYGAADAFFAPAFTGLLPGTVAPVNLQPANALRGLSFSTGSIVGPVLGGALVAFAGGPGGAMLFDAGTFLVSIACLLPLRPRVVAKVLHDEDPQASTDHFLTSLREGWSEVRSRSWVVAFLGGMASYHVIVLPAIFVLGPVLAAEEMDGARSWAIITAGFGLGAVLGDLLLLRWRPRFALRVASLMLVGASCQAAFIGSGLGVWAIAGLEVLAGVCVTGTFTLWETSLQEHVPDRALSRVSSYDYLSSAGLIPVGNLAIGAISAGVGVRPALLGMTVLGVLVAGAIAGRTRRTAAATRRARGGSAGTGLTERSPLGHPSWSAGDPVDRAATRRSRKATWPFTSSSRAVARSAQANRSSSGNSCCRPDLGGHSTVKVLLTAAAASRSPSTAQTRTCLPPDWATVPRSISSPSGTGWPVSSPNSRRAASTGASSGSCSPLGSDQACSCLRAQNGPPRCPTSTSTRGAVGAEPWSPAADRRNTRIPALRFCPMRASSRKHPAPAGVVSEVPPLPAPRRDMATREATATTFDSLVDADGIVLVDFWAAWCGPCRMFAPVFEAASEQHADITFAKVDTEAERELAARAAITSIPTLMAFRDGILVFAQPGALPAPALEQLITAVRGLDMDDVRRQVAAQDGAQDDAAESTG